MALTTKGKFILGSVAAGAYAGDITDDPLSGVLGGTVLGLTASAMKLSTSDIIESGKVVNSFNLDMDKINKDRNSGYNKRDLEALNTLKSRMKGFETRKAKIPELQDRLTELQEGIVAGKSKSTEEARAQKRLGYKILALENKIAQYSDSGLDVMASKVADELKIAGTIITPTYEGLKKHAEGITDPRVARRLNSALSGAKAYQGVVIHDIVTKYPDTKTVISLSKGGAEDRLTMALATQLGNTPEVAREKSKLILDRVLGDTITLQGHNLIFTDKREGAPTVVLPMTAETKEGVMYHSPNNGTHFAVAGVNPYTDAYARGVEVDIKGQGGGRRVPTLQDATKRIHPELLALQLYEGADITQGIEMIKQNLRHDPDSVALETESLDGRLKDQHLNQKFRNAGMSLNLEHILNTDNTGLTDPDQPLTKIKRISTQVGTSSQLKSTMLALQEGLGGDAVNMYSGLSLNTTTSISNSNFNSLAPLNMNQRGATAVGVRDTQVKNRSDAFKRLQAMYGSDFDKQFESSNVFSKLDIADKEGFNAVIGNILGNDYALSDGAGLFNVKNSHLFEHGSAQKLTITSQRNGDFLIKNETIKDMFNMYNSMLDSKHTTSTLNPQFMETYQKARGLLNYNELLLTKKKKGFIQDPLDLDQLFTDIKKGTYDQYLTASKRHQPSFKISSGEAIGLDGEGREISLHNQFSEGTMRELVVDRYGNLGIHVDARFNPGEEKIAKLFSESAKSNLYGAKDYRHAAVIGTLLNSGEVSVVGNELYIPTPNGGPSKKVDKKDIDKLVTNIEEKIAKNIPLNSLEKRLNSAMKSSVILAAEDTNFKDFAQLNKAGDITGILDFIDGKKIKRKVEHSDTERQYIKDFAEKHGGGFHNLRRSAISSFMNSNFKAATDISTTIASDIFKNLEDVLSTGGTKEQKQSVEEMLRHLKMMKDTDTIEDVINNTEEMKDYYKRRVGGTFRAATIASNLVGTNRVMHEDNMMGLLKGLTNTNFTDYAYGLTNTAGSVNKGQAALGVGNQARLSWTAQDQLLQSGFTKEQLKVIGTPEHKTLVELESILGERNTGIGKRHNRYSINSQLNDTNQTDFEAILVRTTPEDRLGKLKQIGIEISDKSPFITYELKNPYKKIERLNFATVSTDRSGFFEAHELELLKEIESKKLQLFHMDNLLSVAPDKDRAKTKLEFDKVAEEYKTLTESTLKGNNSLLKRAASLQVDASNISLARSTGGEASRYIESRLAEQKTTIADSVFISQEGLDLRLKRMGVTKQNTRVVDIPAFPSLKRIEYFNEDAWVPLKSLITREPSQGPLSTTFENLVLDTSIKQSGSGAHLYVTENHRGFLTGKYMDFDQDTLQELFPKLTSAQTQELETRFKGINTALTEMVDAHQYLKVKGSNHITATIRDFKDTEELASYLNAAALQGRERKALAAPSTALAVDLASAFNMEFEKTDGKSIKGRFLGHTLVENLIKSAHLDTKAYKEQTESDIEAFSRLHRAYVSNKISAKTYEEGIRPLIKRQLNLDKVEAGLTDAKPEQVKMLLDSQEDLIRATVNHSKEVASTARNPLHVTQGVGHGDLIERSIDALSQFVETSQGLDLRGGESYGRMAREISVNIAKTIKNNKGILGVGAGALFLASMMTKSGEGGSPDTEAINTERFVRSDASKNLRPYNQVPNAIETNKQARAYVTPKNHTKQSTSVEVQGGFTEAMQYGDMNTYADQAKSISDAIFGDSLRTARFEN